MFGNFVATNFPNNEISNAKRRTSRTTNFPNTILKSQNRKATKFPNDEVPEHLLYYSLGRSYHFQQCISARKKTWLSGFAFTEKMLLLIKARAGVHAGLGGDAHFPPSLFKILKSSYLR